jgi:cysteine sulfinate desulfinase/cysteine desulfurase-like protein
MGVGDDEARSSLRFSFSRMNVAGEVPAALAALEQAAARL